jgi:hypothetical protein
MRTFHPTLLQVRHGYYKTLHTCQTYVYLVTLHVLVMLNAILLRLYRCRRLSAERGQWPP